MGGDSALSAFIGRVRSMGTFATEVAKAAAPLVQDAVRATAKAGADSEGKPWAPKQKGGRALVNAAAALSAKAAGTMIVVTLTGIEVFHNRGTKSLPERRILPDGGAGIPKGIAAAVDRAARITFARIMRAA